MSFAPVAALILLSASLLAADQPLATISITAGHPGKLIPPDFDGFSIEVDDAANMYLGTATSPNLLFYQLLKNLGTGTIRIGGDSTDYSCWQPQKAPQPTGCRFTITPEAVRGFFNSSSATHWPLIVGINLAQNSAAWALEYGIELAKTAAASADSKLLGFEFGNEPDLFHREKLSGRRLIRPPEYSWSGVVKDWKSYIAAFKANQTTAGILLVGPAYDDSSAVWRDRYLAPFIDGVGKTNLGIVTVHEYPTSTCEGSTVTIAELLSEHLMESYRAHAAKWVATARQRGLDLEIGETNSTSCGGQRGVDDTLASALWGLDELFTNASLGFRRVNLHMDHAAYSAVFVTPKKAAAGIRYQNTISPLYYAMYMFADAVNSSILPVEIVSKANIKAYAVSACDTCAVKLFVINKDLNADGMVSVTISKKMGHGSMLLLRAPSLASTSVTIGNQRFDDETGRIANVDVTTLVAGGNQRYSFELPNASAVRLTIEP